MLVCDRPSLPPAAPRIPLQPSQRYNQVNSLEVIDRNVFGLPTESTNAVAGPSTAPSPSGTNETREGEGYKLFANQMLTMLMLKEAGLEDYQPSVRGLWWSFAKDIHVACVEVLRMISRTANSVMSIQGGRISYKSRVSPIVFIEKQIAFDTKTWRKPMGELATYMHPQYLLPLQGDVISPVLDVHINCSGVHIVFQVPDPRAWCQATPRMPDLLKERIIQAYQKIHCRGVLHGAVKLSNIIVSSVGKVTLFDFSESRALTPNGVVPEATPDDLLRELQCVKSMLAYEDDWRSKSTDVVKDPVRNSPNSGRAGNATERPLTNTKFSPGPDLVMYNVPYKDKHGLQVIQYIPRPWMDRTKLKRSRTSSRAGEYVSRDSSAVAGRHSEEDTLPTTPQPQLSRVRPHSPPDALLGPLQQDDVPPTLAHEPLGRLGTSASLQSPSQYALSSHNMPVPTVSRKHTIQPPVAGLAHVQHTDNNERTNNAMKTQGASHVPLPFSKPMRPSSLERQKPDMPPPRTLPIKLHMNLKQSLRTRSQSRPSSTQPSDTHRGQLRPPHTSFPSTADVTSTDDPSARLARARGKLIATAASQGRPLALENILPPGSPVFVVRPPNRKASSTRRSASTTARNAPKTVPSSLSRPAEQQPMITNTTTASVTSTSTATVKMDVDAGSRRTYSQDPPQSRRLGQKRLREAEDIEDEGIVEHGDKGWKRRKVNGSDELRGSLLRQVRYADDGPKEQAVLPVAAETSPVDPFAAIRKYPPSRFWNAKVSDMPMNLPPPWTMFQKHKPEQPSRLQRSRARAAAKSAAAVAAKRAVERTAADIAEEMEVEAMLLDMPSMEAQALRSGWVWSLFNLAG